MTKRSAHQLRLATLRTDAPTAFDYAPSLPDLERMRDEMALLGLRKIRFVGEIMPEGRRDWRLTAQLGATVVQPCSVTLEPVTTRIDETVTRLYTDAFVAPSDGETEMPEDDTQEPLPETIDLSALFEEALALALPAFPRAPSSGADDTPFQASAAPPGVAPLTEEDARPSPFADLADLKRKLEEE